MEKHPSIHGRDDKLLEGSTVQRPLVGEQVSVGSTASIQHLPTSPFATLASRSLSPEATGSDDEKTVIRKPDSDSANKTPPAVANATPASVASILLGTRLNHFLLEELIGGGGMGAVFRARDDRLDRIVAIKVIPFVGEDQDLQRRFRNEAQNAARLDHPYIARVFDVGQFEQWHYIVFEHVEGINIRDLIARDGVLSIDDAVYYTRQIAEAIEHADGRGIVHRDIKPSNVLVGIDGNVKVVDMGLARGQQIEVSGDMTASGVTLGTFDYISPEQARDPRAADVRSDIYSLGCTLYYMLTGSPPYPGGTMLQKLLSHGNAPPPDPRGLRPEVSDNLTAIIHKMLAKDPAARYPHAIDVVADLRELAIREGLVRAQSRGTVTITQSDPVPQFLTRHLPWMVAVSLVLAIAGWLQLTSNISEDEFKIMPPSSPAPKTQATAPVANGSVADINKTAENAAAKNADGSQPPSMSGIDSAAVPPLFSGIAMNRDPGMVTTPIKTPTPISPLASSSVTIEKIVVGGKTVEPNSQLAPTLREAVKMAEDLKVNVIEIASSVTVSPPFQLNSDLTIRSAVGTSEVRFVAGETLWMQRLAMIDVGSNQLNIQNLHLHWNVRSTAIDGGALIRLASDNRMVRLADCTITIENLTARDEVFVFEIANVDGSRVATTNSSTQTLLAALELENVAVRGETAFINLVDATQLDFQWRNGLLATSGRFLEALGSDKVAALGGKQIRLVLDQLTAWNRTGFVRTRLGPSGKYPLMIDRRSSGSVFHNDTNTNHIEFDGLESLINDPGQLVQLRGEDNAYDFDLARDSVVLYFGQENEQDQVFRLADILAPERPSWIADRSPKWVVRWTKPPSVTPSRMTITDFSQDGTLAPGFDKKLLPQFPIRATGEAEN